MAGPNLYMNISMERRSAEVAVTMYWSRRYGIPEGSTPCHVLGLFQESSEEGVYSVMVCELNDGRVLTQVPETIRFVDTEEGVIVK